MTTQKKLTITTDECDAEFSYTHKSEEYITSIKFLEACLEAYRANGYLNDVEITIHLGSGETVNLSFYDGYIDCDEHVMLAETAEKSPTKKDLTNLTHYDWGMGRRD